MGEAQATDASLRNIGKPVIDLAGDDREGSDGYLLAPATGVVRDEQ